MPATLTGPIHHNRQLEKLHSPRLAVTLRAHQDGSILRLATRLFVGICRRPSVIVGVRCKVTEDLSKARIRDVYSLSASPHVVVIARLDTRSGHRGRPISLLSKDPLQFCAGCNTHQSTTNASPLFVAHEVNALAYSSSSLLALAVQDHHFLIIRHTLCDCELKLLLRANADIRQGESVMLKRIPIFFRKGPSLEERSSLKHHKSGTRKLAATGFNGKFTLRL
mmetsp:Transcript_135484/g.351113  ORF Transcript_135484/g.351113 Transcript_135484/m.351113 type:complete len:223 (-) Transcript_135484:795-1463(-)